MEIDFYPDQDPKIRWLRGPKIILAVMVIDASLNGLSYLGHITDTAKMADALSAELNTRSVYFHQIPLGDAFLATVPEEPHKSPFRLYGKGAVIPVIVGTGEVRQNIPPEDPTESVPDEPERFQVAHAQSKDIPFEIDSVEATQEPQQTETVPEEPALTQVVQLSSVSSKADLGVLELVPDEPQRGRIVPAQGKGLLSISGEADANVISAAPDEPPRSRDDGVFNLPYPPRLKT